MISYCDLIFSCSQCIHNLKIDQAETFIILGRNNTRHNPLTLYCYMGRNYSLYTREGNVLLTMFGIKVDEL